VGSQVKAFFQTERKKVALFPRRILLEFLRFLYLPSSVYTRIGSTEFQDSRKIFRDTSVQYHRQTEMLRRKQQPVIVGIALSSAPGVCRFWLKCDNPEIVLLPAPPHHLIYEDC
jgi:hypothetical protein